MKRTNTFLVGIFLLVMLSVGMIGAGERLPPEGPLAQLYAQIHALFVETGLLAAESNDQQEQIDQLTVAVCELSVLTGNRGASKSILNVQAVADVPGAVGPVPLPTNARVVVMDRAIVILFVETRLPHFREIFLRRSAT